MIFDIENSLRKTNFSTFLTRMHSSAKQSGKLFIGENPLSKWVAKGVASDPHDFTIEVLHTKRGIFAKYHQSGTALEK